MKLKTTSFILSLFLCSVAFSYNHRKCTLAYKDYYPFGMSTSTSSFFTSTGECAMIGLAEHDKKVFISHNIDQMQIDSSRGQGEYLSTYANLLGCSKDSTKKLAVSLQKNMTAVFGLKLDNSPEQAYNEIELLIFNDPALSANCNPKI